MHKAPSPEEQGVTSAECQGTIAASRQAYVHRQARSLCSCAREGMWEEGWGAKAGGGVLGTYTAGLAQRVLLVGQPLGGGLRGEACLLIWL